MRYFKLCGREVSVLALGTDYFGTTVSKEDSFAIMDRFLSSGGNAIDTARLYASWLPNGVGASEKTIGEWMKSRKNREQVFLITKGGAVDKGSTERARLSRNDLRYDITESLKALQCETIDLYFLHRDDETKPVEEIMPTLAEFVKEGKVKALGASNWRARRIAEANAFCEKEGLPPFTASEVQWSLARSTPEKHDDLSLVCMNEEEYDYYLASGMPVFAFSSQAKGFFIRGAASGVDSNNQKAISRFASEENIGRLNRVKDLMAKKDMSAAAVSLASLSSRPFPVSTLVGCKTLAQLEDSLTAADATLTQEEINYLTDGQKL